MGLEEFARAQGESGYHYEFQKGIIQVVEVPGLPHALVVQVIRDALTAYKIDDPESIFVIAGGGEAAMRMPEMQSERHPDLAVYLTRPMVEDEDPWEFWTPDIAVEVVSASSEERDCKIKPQEYLTAGVRL